jgi:hypothetical protein
VTPRAQVEAFLREQPGLFAAVPDGDGSGLQIFETGSGKSLRVRWADLADAVIRRTSLRPAPYLVLVFQDGRQVALADVGFAFAPSTASTGPLPDLPQTFCFRDFRHLSQGIEAILAEEGREREALSAVLLAIALLDGARIVGFEVGREERTLMGLLGRLEERGVRV